MNVTGRRPEHPLLVIVGPTGSGKTALSIFLAQQFNGEIVSCDSVAVYRGLEIGTAKPSLEERTRVPHHLIDVADPAEPFTAGEYARQARAALNEIKGKKKLPIVVGGTGLYLRALIEGLFPGPQRSDPLRVRLRQKLAERGPSYLHRVLQRMDKDAAASIHPNDAPKIIRAIEICLAAREKMSEMFKRGRDPLTGFHILRLGLDPDRNQLYERINARSERMFANGLLDETRALVSKYGAASDSIFALNSLGYRQARQHLRGELDFGQALAATQQAHRNYAKRQLTWFRNIAAEDTEWIRGFGDSPEVQEETLAKAKAFLG